ncbi:MAG: hypothetical protein V7K27_14880 [Nostoc sp.]|uniref:hypothetical protein n=1 Tax=Nostoc sp. TaxID=1180 RepID=UPI002FF5EE0B
MEFGETRLIASVQEFGVISPSSSSSPSSPPLPTPHSPLKIATQHYFGELNY